MKLSFPEFYSYKQDEFTEMFNNCYFVFDANALLNLYRYTKETRDEMLKILEEIKDRLWMPHQVGLEFHYNRANVILEQKAIYGKVCKEINEQANGFINKINSDFQKIKSHPNINIREIISEIQKTINNKVEEIESYEKEHPNFLEEDDILETLNKLYEDKVGDSYTQNELNIIYEEGENRYKKKYPPGFEDEREKKGKTKEYNGIIYNDQYGDLVVWKQMIKKAAEDKKPIVFITDDRKEDWWRKEKGQTIGPRIELLNEFKREVGYSFYMYGPSQFMNQIKVHLQTDINEDVINEMNDLRAGSISDDAVNNLNSVYDSHIDDEDGFIYVTTFEEAIKQEEDAVTKYLLQLRDLCKEKDQMDIYLQYKNEYRKLAIEYQSVLEGIVNVDDYLERLKYLKKTVLSFLLLDL